LAVVGDKGTVFFDGPRNTSLIPPRERLRALRRCWRQVAIVVPGVLENRPPAALCVPTDGFRQIAARRSDRSPVLPPPLHFPVLLLS